MTVSADQRNDVSEGRLYFWEVAFEMANANPILGVGHNSFMAAFNQYDTSNGQYGTRRAVHSSWMAVLADLGYPGADSLRRQHRTVSGRKPARAANWPNGDLIWPTSAPLPRRWARVSSPSASAGPS